MSWQLRQLEGSVFGRLTVLRLAGFTQGKMKDRWRSVSAIWTCVCICGNEKDIRGANLTSRRTVTKSCGCLAAELAAARLAGKCGQDSVAYRHSVHGRDERGRFLAA
jgi:hypothetical protein